jgi:hypothetical protein
LTRIYGNGASGAPEARAPEPAEGGPQRARALSPARADELMYAAKGEEKGSIRLGVFTGGASAPAAAPP